MSSHIRECALASSCVGDYWEANPVHPLPSTLPSVAWRLEQLFTTNIGSGLFSTGSSKYYRAVVTMEEATGLLDGSVRRLVVTTHPSLPVEPEHPSDWHQHQNGMYITR